MRRIDELPAEQRAVLQLVLRRGTSFEELAGVLGIDEAEMRRRAHAALEALGPDDTGLEPARRAEIGDWLLGQQSEEQRAGTERMLAGSPAGRAWAHAVADRLRVLGAERLPEIPAEGDAAPAEPALPPAVPVGAAAATPPAAPAAAEAAAPVDHAVDAADPRAGAPRSSRRGGAIAIGALALVTIAVILFLVLRGGGSDGATPAASTTATQPRPRIEAKATLLPPSSRTGLKALGVVLVQRVRGRQQIVAEAQGLPTPKRGGYGIWLSAGPGKARWLGFFASQDRRGRLLGVRQLDTSIADYREVLITREATGRPTHPGPVFLRGPVQPANGG
jgi:hypothetical protein